MLVWLTCPFGPGIPGLADSDLPSTEFRGETLPIVDKEADFLWSLTVKFFIEFSVANVPIVETDDKDDASSSSFPRIPFIRFAVVELCLFFLGIGGRTFPGNSTRNFL